MELSIRPSSGEIHGQEFHDLDRDGFNEAGEPGLVGWTIYLDRNDNGVLDGTEPSTTTDSHGEYAFTDLAPFTTYIVRQVPAGILGPNSTAVD